MNGNDRLPLTNFILPTRGRILIIEDKFNYKGKLVIPETSQRKNTTGEVLAIGPEVEILYYPDNETMVPNKLEVGDRVLFNVFSGTAVKFHGYAYHRLLQQDEVMSVLTNKEAELEDVGA